MRPKKVKSDRRRFRAVLLTAAMALPLLGASECSSLLDPDGDGATNVDGRYELVEVSGTPIGSGYNIHYVDSRNKLVLERGVWEISGGGTRLDTEMYSWMMVDGQTYKGEFWPERHTGTISVTGTSATGTLDNGTQVWASIEDGTLLTDQYGNSLLFRKTY